MGRRLILLSASLFLLAGCAGVEVTRVKNGSDNGGIRFYRPWPYLLVVPAANGGVEAKTVYLPRLDQEYSIKVKPGLGTVNGKFTLSDGWNLTDFGDTRDSKVPETIAALSGAATAAGDLKAAGAEVSIPAGLYEYEIDERSGKVTGLKKISIK